MEFPHLLRLIEETQFDTIYHEHYSYLSLLAVEQVFGAHGLRLFDVEELRSHGGSLRIYACHADGPHETTERIARAPRARGRREGCTSSRPTRRSASGCARSSARCSSFLVSAREEGKTRRRLRRGGQGRHARQLLRHPQGPRRLRRRPQRAQAGPLHAGEPHPRARAGARRRDEARLPAHPRLEPEGRDHGPDVPRPRATAPASSPRCPTWRFTSSDRARGRRDRGLERHRARGRPGARGRRLRRRAGGAPRRPARASWRRSWAKRRWRFRRTSPTGDRCRSSSSARLTASAASTWS